MSRSPAEHSAGLLFQRAAAPRPGADAARKCKLGGGLPLGVSYAAPVLRATGHGSLVLPGPPPDRKKRGLFMIKIAPSILSADFANLERDIQQIGRAHV